MKRTIFSCDAPSMLLPHIASRLLAECAGDTMALADAVLLLPSRRACIAMVEQFAQQSTASAMVLPRIYPLGDIDEGLAAEMLFNHASDTLPPAIDGPHRLAEITALVMEYCSSQAEGRGENMAQASVMARDMMRFLDELDREMIDPQAVLALRPGAYARHWQERLRVLHHVIQRWPARLAQLGMMSPYARRNAQLLALAKQWETYPPAYPVYVVGSTGSQPATRALMKVVAGLPKGALWLPQLDVQAPETLWQQMEPTHPLWLYRQLLAEMGAEPAEVQMLEDATASPQHRQMWRRVHMPATMAGQHQNRQNTEEWPTPICTVCCDDSLHEAMTGALLLAENAHNKNIAVALVCQDEKLIQTVLAQLAARGIVPNVGVGISVETLPHMQWLRIVHEAAAQDTSAAAWLVMMKHSLGPCSGNAQAALLRDETESQILRGVRKAMRVEETITGWLHTHPAASSDDAALLLQSFEQLAPLRHMLRRPRVAASELWQCHVQTAMQMAQARWSAPPWLERMTQAMHACGEIAPAEYLPLLKVLAATIKAFDSNVTHPQLHVLSPMEARLVPFERVILSGMTEGGWPSRPTSDHWLNEAQRQKLGLPPSLVHIGQQALDMMALASAPDVFMTHAKRVHGEVALPSRWLERARAAGVNWPENVRWAQWARTALLSDVSVQIAPPEPLAWEDSFPQELWATHLDMLHTDPYGFYARHILKLKEQEALDKQPDAATYGSMVHAVWQEFIERINAGEAPSGALFEQAGNKAARPYRSWPVVQAVWQPRLSALAVAASAIEQQVRAAGACIQAEKEVRAALQDISGKAFQLCARIDRLEQYPDGSWRVIDYKTGGVPNTAAIAQGYACQMPAAALAVQREKGGVSVGFAYWKIASGRTPVRTEALHNPQEAMPLIEQLSDHLPQLIGAYRTMQRPFWSVPVPSMVPRYHAYAHLARCDEWQQSDLAA